MHTNAKDAIYDTIHCIVASPLVVEYMVGYTRRPGKQRLAEYWAMHGYQHLVVLANGLTLEEGRELERYLQENIWMSNRSGSLYQKYNAERRDAGRHIPSIGPTPPPDHEGHTVYMAWKNDLAYD